MKKYLLFALFVLSLPAASAAVKTHDSSYQSEHTDSQKLLIKKIKKPFLLWQALKVLTAYIIWNEADARYLIRPGNDKTVELYTQLAKFYGLKALAMLCTLSAVNQTLNIEMEVKAHKS